MIWSSEMWLSPVASIKLKAVGGEEHITTILVISDAGYFANLNSETPCYGIQAEWFFWWFFPLCGSEVCNET